MNGGQDMSDPLWRGKTWSDWDDDGKISTSRSGVSAAVPVPAETEVVIIEAAVWEAIVDAPGSASITEGHEP